MENTLVVLPNNLREKLIDIRDLVQGLRVSTGSEALMVLDHFEEIINKAEQHYLEKCETIEIIIDKHQEKMDGEPALTQKKFMIASQGVYKKILKAEANDLIVKLERFQREIKSLTW